MSATRRRAVLGAAVSVGFLVSVAGCRQPGLTEGEGYTQVRGFLRSVEAR